MMVFIDNCFVTASYAVPAIQASMVFIYNGLPPSYRSQWGVAIMGGPLTNIWAMVNFMRG